MSEQSSYIQDARQVIPNLLTKTKGKFPFRIYRGQVRDFETGLVPSIFRKVHISEKPYDMEREIYTDFRNLIRGQSISTDLNNAWEMLFYAQHIGVPTRLLDWSINPLVALYFAVEDAYRDEQSHAVFFEFNVTKYYNREHPANIREKRVGHRGVNIADLPRNRPFLQHLVRDDRDIDGMTGVHVVQPPMIDSRIEAQSAVFTVDLDADGSTGYALSSSHITKRFIKGEDKAKIKTQLYRMGIHAGSLFPDVNGIGRYLTDRHDRENWLRKP
jgi:hypothetical protein